MVVCFGSVSCLVLQRQVTLVREDTSKEKQLLSNEHVLFGFTYENIKLGFSNACWQKGVLL